MNIKFIVDLIKYLLTSHTTESKSSSKSQPSPSLEAKVPEAPVKPHLRSDDEFYLWSKNERFKLSDHFTTSEFSCHCKYPECKEQKISKSLITKLESIRVEINQPMIVTSAYRCQKHQEYIRSSGQSTVVAKKLSQHELGNAADILPKDGKNIRTEFLTTCEKQFQAIGLSDEFLHVDLRPQHIRWEY